MSQHPEGLLENCNWKLGGQQQPPHTTHTGNCRKYIIYFNSRFSEQVSVAVKTLIGFLPIFHATVLLHTDLYLCSLQLSTVLLLTSSSNIWIPSVSASPVSFKSVLAHLPEDLNSAHFCRAD